MATQKFKYYLHDNCDHHERIDAIRGQGVKLSELAWEDLGNPFYEIALECEVDKNGKVKILGISQ